MEEVEEADAPAKGPYYITAELLRMKLQFADWAVVKVMCECGAVMLIHAANPDKKLAELANSAIAHLMEGNQLNGTCIECGADHYISRPLISNPNQPGPKLVTP